MYVCVSGERECVCVCVCVCVRMRNTNTVLSFSSTQDAAELMGICDMLVQKGKFQKASDLLYSVAISDPHNEELKARWKDLIAKANNQNVEINRAAAEKERVATLALEAKLAGGQAALSETKRWAGLKQQVRLICGTALEEEQPGSNSLKALSSRRSLVRTATSPQNLLPKNDPNWHMQKLKPWMGPEAFALGVQYQESAAKNPDPFKKVGGEALGRSSGGVGMLVRVFVLGRGVCVCVDWRRMRPALSHTFTHKHTHTHALH
jgi:hypothetical protein